MAAPMRRWTAPRSVLSAAVLAVLALLGVLQIWHTLDSIEEALPQYGFTAVRDLHMVQNDIDMLRATLALAMLAPERPEAVERLSVAADLVFIRLARQDQSDFLAQFPQHAALLAEALRIIEGIDGLVGQGAPLDVARLAQLSREWEPIETRIHDAYYEFGNLTDIALQDHQRNLSQLKNQMVAALAALVVAVLGIGLLLVRRSEALARLRAAERSGERARLQLQEAIESLTDAFALYDADDRLVMCNAGYHQTYGGPRPYIRQGARFADLLRAWLATDNVSIPASDYESWITARMQRHERADGKPYELVLDDGRSLRIREQRTRSGSIAAIAVDITELKQRERALEASETRYRTLAETTATGIWQVDASGLTLYANAAMPALLDLPATDRLEAVRLQDALPDRRVIDLLERIGAKHPADGLRIETELRLPGGGNRKVLLSMIGLDEPSGRSLLASVVDLSEQKDAEAKARHLAFHDNLTGLANRAAMAEHLPGLISQSRAQAHRLAILALDLDRFKEVNDGLGHHVGDLLLKTAADRLRAIVRQSDVVVRLGGDEFAVLLPGLAMAEDAVGIAADVARALNGKVELDGHDVTLECSVGVAVYPDHAANADELLRFADLALYRAKRDRRGGVACFTRALSDELDGRRAMEAALRRAIEQDELTLAWQPQLALRHDRIEGAEALARWHDPVRGCNVPAGEFIPVAEQSSLILELDAKVLELACRQAVGWLQRLPHRLRASVNLSGAQFRRPELPELIARALDAAKLPAHLLELEITEGVLLENRRTSGAILHRLHELGVHLALDDFGTGYSSLSYLKDLPVHRLKIDLSFVAGLEHDRRKRAIVQAILGLARSLGMTTVAEGVETTEQLAILRQEGCDVVQGYLIARPTAAAHLEEWLARRVGPPSAAAANAATGSRPVPPTLVEPA